MWAEQAKDRATLDTWLSATRAAGEGVVALENSIFRQSFSFSGQPSTKSRECRNLHREMFPSISSLVAARTHAAGSVKARSIKLSSANDDFPAPEVTASQERMVVVAGKKAVRRLTIASHLRPCVRARARARARACTRACVSPRGDGVTQDRAR
eukprot:COSAG01_NODE_905_length_12840_cov_12.409544_7_plen_154_part_00